MARPKQQRWLDVDDAIGHACGQLMYWGYPGAQVFEAVAAEADRLFNRGAGHERVRQIYRRWAKEARTVGYREPGAFTKDSRAASRPQGPIDALAAQLLREYRPRSLQRRARLREALARAEVRAGQIDECSQPSAPNALDDPRWFAVGAGTHPEDMNDVQRAAFEALPRHLQEEYRKLVAEDARRCEKDEADTRARWEQFKPLVDAAFAEVDKEIADGVYAPPGVGRDLDVTPIRGRRQRRK